VNQQADQPDASLAAALDGAARDRGVGVPLRVLVPPRAERWSAEWLCGARILWPAGTETNAFGLPEEIATHLPRSAATCQLDLEAVGLPTGAPVRQVVTHVDGHLLARRTDRAPDAAAALTTPWATLAAWVSGDGCLVPDTTAGPFRFGGDVAVISFFEGALAGVDDLAAFQARARVLAAALRALGAEEAP